MNKLRIMVSVILIIITLIFMPSLSAEKKVDQVLPDKVWTVEFSQKMDPSSISNSSVYVEEASGEKVSTISTKLDESGKKLMVRNEEEYIPGETYRLYVNSQLKSIEQYNLKEDRVHTFQVSELPQEESLTYLGITDTVSNIFAEGETVKNVHHYEADMGVGNPINIYVTKDYEHQYGKGFAYSETVDIINSISEFRNEKPFTKKNATLDIFFYTNDSGTPFDQNHQAVISHSGLSEDGARTEMLMNGSTMPYDFRTSYVHEFVHYFDFQSFYEKYRDSYAKYWGDNYRLFLLEGAAEYIGYFSYDYPENTHNGYNIRDLKPERDSILNYAFNQGGGSEKLLFDRELNSFNDIAEAGNNNYGVYLALYWYLVEEYGYFELKEYFRYIGSHFEGASSISQTEKNETAKKFLGKTEAEIIQEWLEYFDYFGGELKEFSETEVATVNEVVTEETGGLPSSVRSRVGFDQEGNYTFGLNIEEWIENRNHTQAYSFLDHSSEKLELKAKGYQTVEAVRKGGFQTGSFENGDRLFNITFMIPSTEVSKLNEGVEYNIHPIENDPVYHWVIPESQTFNW